MCRSLLFSPFGVGSIAKQWRTAKALIFRRRMEKLVIGNNIGRNLSKPCKMLLEKWKRAATNTHGYNAKEN